MENSSELNKVLSNPSHSKHSKSQASSFADLADPKKRYAAVIQQERQHERAQLHQRLEKQKGEQEKAHKRHLKAEISKRRKQLQHLEREKQSGIEENKRAAHQALLKKEKDAIKKMEEAILAKTADEKSKTRFREAKERQKEIEKELNLKRTQAEHLRKTHLKTEKAERAEAVHFNQSMLQRQVREHEQKVNNEKSAVEEYRKGLSLHGFSQKLIDSRKPITLVFRQNEEEGEAMSKAQKQELRNSEKEKLREEAALGLRRKAEDRGSQVLSKMQRQREYEAYCKEAEEEQRRYNLRRLQAGKKNQFAGVKPLTLSQIDINKKLKSQKQFEKMFIQGAAGQSSEPAGKYKITENKMIDVVAKPTKAEKWVKQPIDYADHQSLIPGVSEGHYSFQSEPEDDRPIRGGDSNKATVKPIMRETATRQAAESTGKTRLKQTRLSNEAVRQELDYSDSEEDSNI